MPNYEARATEPEPSRQAPSKTKEELQHGRSTRIAEGLAAPAAPYSPGYRSGQLVCTAGMLALDSSGNLIGAGDAGAQTRQVLENVKEIIEAAGGTLEDIVYNMIFLADLGDYQAMNEVYGSYFPENPPARACVQAGLVKPEFLVEIAATAVLGD